MVYINKVKVVNYVVNKVLYGINKRYIEEFYSNRYYGSCRNEIKFKKGEMEIILRNKWSGNEK